MIDFLYRLINDYSWYFRIPAYIFNFTTICYFLYTRSENFHETFRSMGIDIELIIKMIMASLACLISVIAAAAINNKVIFVPVCILIIFMTFYLMSHTRVFETGDED